MVSFQLNWVSCRDNFTSLVLSHYHEPQMCGGFQVKAASGLILLVLFFPLGDFSPVTQVFPSHQNNIRKF